MELAKATILVNYRTPCQTYNKLNLHNVTLRDIIKYISHKFHFGDTNNQPYRVNNTGKDNSTDGDDNYDMVHIKLSKTDKVYTS